MTREQDTAGRVPVPWRLTADWPLSAAGANATRA